MKKRFALPLLTAALTFLTPLGAQAADEVKIAIAGPFTGANAAFGEQLWIGASAAVDALNASGGINGKPILLIKADDACEPKQAVAVANRMVDQEKVAAVVGHFCSSSHIPASEIYDEADTLSMACGATNPVITERKMPTVTRIVGRDDQQAAVLADFIAKKLGAKTIAIVHDKDTYGRGLADATRTAVEKLGVKVALFDGVNRGERDYNALVTRIRSANVDAVFFGGLHSEAGVLVRQMREQGMTLPFVSDDGIVDPAFVTAAGGKQYAQGVYMTFPKDPRSMESSKDVVAKLSAEGKKSDGFTLYAYAGIQAVAEALKNAKSTSGAELANWLKNNQVNTVLGTKAWDQKGDLKEADYVVYQWDGDGSYAELK